VKKIRAETRHILEGSQVTARKLSQLLGQLQAATRAIPLALLFYRQLQQALQRAVEQSDQDYSVQLVRSIGGNRRSCSGGWTICQPGMARHDVRETLSDDIVQQGIKFQNLNLLVLPSHGEIPA